MDHNEKNADSDRARVVATSCLLIITADDSGAASNYVQRTLRAATKLQLRRRLLIFQRLIFSRVLSYFIWLIITLPSTNETCLRNEWSGLIIASWNIRAGTRDSRGPEYYFPNEGAIKVIGFHYGLVTIIPKSSFRERRLAFQSQTFRQSRLSRTLPFHFPEKS